ncbi:TnsA-like heteromeric transposase endonuclease subunit [Streptomyces tirandamycinicus]|uniref:TnsA-like heteromeric transposase endonuclease subunit n=1 Tax=Streptomyces tirandamycinicus TaxID=2174846 RepID=UPI00344148AC
MATAPSVDRSGRPGSDYGLEFVVLGEGRVSGCLADHWDVRFEDAPPVRSFQFAKGSRSYPGLYWSATMRRHVGYESWLERDHLKLLDFDRQIVGIASQPFRISWVQDGTVRHHTPDYFARRANGTGVVIDVRADDRIGDKDAAAFAATETACSQVGWEFRRVGAPAAVLMANVRWLAGYRHPRAYREVVAQVLVEVFADPTRLSVGAAQAGHPIVVLPVLFHLMWTGVLTADLRRAVLAGTTLVRTDGEEWR